MKSNTFLAGVAVIVSLLSLGTTVQAAPLGSLNEEMDHIVPVADLSRWSAGLYAHTRDRDVKVDGSALTTFMTQEKAMGYLGYTLLRGVTVYGTAGSGKTEFQRAYEGDYEAEYGGGVRLGLLDHSILDPLLLEDKIRLTATVQYTLTQTEIWPWSNGLEWGELSANLLLSIVNDINGNKLFWPESIAVYGGALYTRLFGDLEDEDNWRLTFGLEVFVTERVALDAAVEMLDGGGSAGSSFGLNVRF